MVLVAGQDKSQLRNNISFLYLITKEKIKQKIIKTSKKIYLQIIILPFKNISPQMLVMFAAEIKFIFWYPFFHFVSTNPRNSPVNSQKIYTPEVLNTESMIDHMNQRLNKRILSLEYGAVY